MATPQPVPLDPKKPSSEEAAACTGRLYPGRSRRSGRRLDQAGPHRAAVVLVQAGLDGSWRVPSVWSPAGPPAPCP